MSLTTNKDDERLKVTKENGLQEAYLILPEDERKKPFKRPLRTTYTHKGRYFKIPPIMLDKPIKTDEKEFVAKIPALVKDVTPIGYAMLTQEDVDQYNKTGGYIGGCGTNTVMKEEIAETWACDPEYYTSTFCVHCGKHFPVNEFVWTNTNLTLGT